MSTNGFAAVLRRMKLITATNTDSELSSALALSPQTLSSWKIRNSIPYSLCVNLAACHDVSLDWLILGEGPQQRACSNNAAVIDDGTENWESRLLNQLRALGPQDRQAIAKAVEEKQRFRQLERQVEEMSRQLYAGH